MRKKIQVLVMALCLCVSMASCSSNISEPVSSTSSSEITSVTADPSDSPSSRVDFSELIEVVQKELIPSGDKLMFIAELKNISKEQISFRKTRLDVLDMDSNYIGTISDIYFRPQIIDPGESTYIYEDVLSGIRVAKDDETIDAYSIGNITIRPEYFISSGILPVDSDVSGLSLSIGSSGGVVATGSVTNNETEDIPDTWVIIPIRDEEKRIRVVLLEEIGVLRGGDVVNFTAHDYNNVTIDIKNVDLSDVVVVGPQKMWGANVRIGDIYTFSDETSTHLNPQEECTPTPEPTPDPTPEPEKNTTTAGQRNALKKANSYLKYSNFSYQGLVEQLEYEKFSHEDAVYAVDHCGADWNEQALGKAKSYLDYSAFSYTGLISQLEYEGFTAEQAAYGADNCNADWNEQAAKSAKSYLDYSSFSRDSLIDQLVYEGFTYEQAVYGVDAVGL